MEKRFRRNHFSHPYSEGVRDSENGFVLSDVLAQLMSTHRDHALVNEIDTCIEHICDLGCGRVYRIIDLMEQGDAVPELNGVNTEIHQVVLKELKTIMAVYDARNGGASCKMPVPN